MLRESMTTYCPSVATIRDSGLLEELSVEIIARYLWKNYS